MLDKFFLKYEEGIKLTPPLPPGRTTFKKPSIIRVKLKDWSFQFEDPYSHFFTVIFMILVERKCILQK